MLKDCKPDDECRAIRNVLQEPRPAAALQIQVDSSSHPCQRHPGPVVNLGVGRTHRYQGLVNFPVIR